MAKQTLRERYIQGLTAMGYEQEEHRSSRFLCFHKRGQSFIFVGKSGSLRYNSTINSTASITVSTKMRMLVLSKVPA